MKLIGLTGGIGSGKSTVASLFNILGLPVYASDERAKLLMVNDPVKKNIIQLFGTSAYNADGSLNNKWIADHVFNDRSSLEKLNAIVHPAVFEDLKKWATEETQSSAPYLIQESAIIFEEGLTGRFHAIIVVAANEEERIQRVMKRDNISAENIQARMHHQWDDDRKIPLADYVIYNDSGRSLINQVRDVDAMIRSTL